MAGGPARRAGGSAVVAGSACCAQTLAVSWLLRFGRCSLTALRLLLFRCGGRVLAVEAGAVREIIAAQDATRIPGAPAAVRGLVNVRGTLVPVVDTAAAAGLPGAGSMTSLVLVERHGRPVALAVDEVLDLVSVPEGALGDRASLPGVRPDLVQAVGTAAGQDFVQLATDALLEPLLP